MRKERRHYTAEEKVAILRRHLLDKVPVSDLCEELGLQPTVFYRWQKEFFENGAAALRDPDTACELGLRHIETPEFADPSTDGTEVDLRSRLRFCSNRHRPRRRQGPCEQTGRTSSAALAFTNRSTRSLSARELLNE